jgi:hypothetical protein
LLDRTGGAPGLAARLGLPVAPSVTAVAQDGAAHSRREPESTANAVTFFIELFGLRALTIIECSKAYGHVHGP